MYLEGILCKVVGFKVKETEVTNEAGEALFSQWTGKFYLSPPQHRYLCCRRRNRLNKKSSFTHLFEALMVPKIVLLKLTKIEHEAYDIELSLLTERGCCALRLQECHVLHGLGCRNLCFAGEEGSGGKTVCGK